VIVAHKERLTDDLPAAIRACKPELLAVLAETDRLLVQVAERYQWTSEDIADARAGCSRDPLAHHEMFAAWLAEPWEGTPTPLPPPPNLTAPGAKPNDRSNSGDAAGLDAAALGSAFGPSKPLNDLGAMERHARL
jgi:hypothetical protein